MSNKLDRHFGLFGGIGGLALQEALEIQHEEALQKSHAQKRKTDNSDYNELYDEYIQLNDDFLHNYKIIQHNKVVIRSLENKVSELSNGSAELNKTNERLENEIKHLRSELERVSSVAKKQHMDALAFKESAAGKKANLLKAKNELIEKHKKINVFNHALAYEIGSKTHEATLKRNIIKVLSTQNRFLKSIVKNAIFAGVFKRDDVLNNLKTWIKNEDNSDENMGCVSYDEALSLLKTQSNNAVKGLDLERDLSSLGIKQKE